MMRSVPPRLRAPLSMLAGGAVIACLAALAAGAPLWPFAICTVVPAVTFIAGWAIYGERGGQDENPGHRITG
jgi:hypothetical protein